MDLDNLIPFVIFVFFVLTSILKRLARKSKPPQDEEIDAPAPVQKKRKGLMGALRERLEALMEEAARQQETQRGTYTYEEEQDDYEEAPAVSAPPPQSVRPGARRRLVTPAHTAGIADAAATCAGRRPLSHRQLRQAVIWSEIIGPPKALREGDGQTPLSLE